MANYFMTTQRQRCTVQGCEAGYPSTTWSDKADKYVIEPGTARYRLILVELCERTGEENGKYWVRTSSSPTHCRTCMRKAIEADRLMIRASADDGRYAFSRCEGCFCLQTDSRAGFRLCAPCLRREKDAS